MSATVYVGGNSTAPACAHAGSIAIGNVALHAGVPAPTASHCTGVAPGITSSSPVASTATLGRLITASSG